MKHTYRIFILMLTAVAACSCGKWLDVQPKTSVEEKDLFAKEYGFKDALTGFYLKMGTANLYAGELSYHYIEMLAGRYDTAPDINNWTTVYAYDGNYKSTVNMVYSGIYNIIANINNFLHFTDVNRSVITTPHYYETMRGEALALRAFLHFDLLRLYGPVYKTDPDGRAVPYRTSFDNIATPLLSAREIVDLCIGDLKEAEQLLADHDSEIFGFDDSADPFTEMRQMRMNLWAVRALLARVYCYRGDDESKAAALEYAKSVIDCGHFSLAQTVDLPLMPTEHIFALYIDEYYRITDNHYQYVDKSNRMSITYDHGEQWYTDQSDIRRNWFSFDQLSRKAFLTKFNNNTGLNRYQYSGADTQPLIRLSEMYYIAAECEPDPATAAEYLNEVILSRTGRNNATLTAGFDEPDSRTVLGVATGQTVRINELMKEYLKDFYGEGQLFYFYKRHDFRNFPNCRFDGDGMHERYTLPLPDNEYIFGNNN